MGHPYRQNKKLFDTSMMVMAYCLEKAASDNSFRDDIKDWCRDKEFTALAFRVYENLCCGHTLCSVKVLTDSILEDEVVSNLPMPKNSDDESDCWLGVTCGQFLGYPTKDNEEIVEKALSEFSEDLEVGYLSEIFERHPEWR